MSSNPTSAQRERDRNYDDRNSATSNSYFHDNDNFGSEHSSTHQNHHTNRPHSSPRNTNHSNSSNNYNNSRYGQHRDGTSRQSRDFSDARDRREEQRNEGQRRSQPHNSYRSPSHSRSNNNNNNNNNHHNNSSTSNHSNLPNINIKPLNSNLNDAVRTQPEQETDQRILNNRLEAIRITKLRPQYESYLLAVPKDCRNSAKRLGEHPKTPPFSSKMSQRKYNGLFAQWVGLLHGWSDGRQGYSSTEEMKLNRVQRLQNQQGTNNNNNNNNNNNAQSTSNDADNYDNYDDDNNYLDSIPNFSLNNESSNENGFHNTGDDDNDNDDEEALAAALALANSL